MSQIPAASCVVAHRPAYSPNWRGASERAALNVVTSTAAFDATPPLRAQARSLAATPEREAGPPSRESARVAASRTPDPTVLGAEQKLIGDTRACGNQRWRTRCIAELAGWGSSNVDSGLASGDLSATRRS